MANFNAQEYTSRYLENLLLGNRLACSKITKEYLSQNNSITDLYEDVFKVALYEIGRLWETNQISVAAEHIATAITEGILNELFDQIVSKKRMNKRVVVACVEKELHQVGIKMVADSFEMLGWESFFLGTGIPNSELARYIHEVKPDIIAISLSVYFNFANLMKMLENLRTEFPELQIIVGGQAFQQVSSELIERFGNVVLFSDLYVLKKYIEFLNHK